MKKRELFRWVQNKYYWTLYRIVDTKDIVKRWMNKLLYKPIYYRYWSRDCDMCEVEWVGIFYGSKKAFVRMAQECMESAEGPTTFGYISKEMYEQEEGKTNCRDRVMEAYENGRGNSIYV
jgi:hypothetical protein